MRFNKLADWLQWQEKLHPTTIELGLDRCRAVLQRMQLVNDGCTIITVAGTNGKGSTVSMLAKMLQLAGYRVGRYTSPHLLRYNERIAINDQLVTDEQLVAAFDYIDSCRGETSLTYFEFSTLAALWIFTQQQVEFMVLEVGLGGRLDATNVVNADLAIITPIDLDHCQWLGNDREQIALEKGGILRRGAKVVVSDTDPPHSLTELIDSLQMNTSYLGSDCKISGDSYNWNWCWCDYQVNYRFTRILPAHQLVNLAAAMNALVMLLDWQQCRAAVEQLEQVVAAIPQGRIAIYELEKYPQCQIVLDVAHNGHAAMALASFLRHHPSTGKRYALVGVLADKDYQLLLAPLLHLFSAWQVVPLGGERGSSGKLVYRHLQQLGEVAVLASSIEDGWRQSMALLRQGDQLVVLGSFYTVSAVISLL